VGEKPYSTVANRSGRCCVCKEITYPGQTIAFKKGMTKDKREVNIPGHAWCLFPDDFKPVPPATSSTPSPAPSSTPPSSGGTTSGGATDTLPAARSSSEDPWVQIAVWVPASRVGILVEAAKEARKGTERPNEGGRA